MRHDKKPAGWLAYQHYLMTGTVWGFHEGAVQRGPGTPPSDPVDFETFLRMARAIPKPAGKPTPEADRYADVTDFARLRSMWGVS